MKLTFLLILPLFISSCVSTKNLGKVLSAELGQGKLTQGEIIGGLKEALSKGSSVGSQLLSKKDGFLGNALVKIAFPKEAQKLKNTLNSIGLNSLTEKVEVSLNRAAEKASAKAAPIFLSAIENMTIEDGMKILTGPANAATEYLKKATSGELKKAFAPIIASSLNQVSATKYWGEATSRYNMIPFVKPVQTNLKSYVTDNALKGIFTMIAKEEVKIRKNPLERTTELLKRVFGYAQNK